jgi:hypothetical protein
MNRRELIMSNPIPSVMVYFDEKQRRAVLCLDQAHPPATISPCSGGEGHEFHTHGWRKRGWMSEAAFMTDRFPIKELAAHFVHDVLFCVVKIRDDYDRMEHKLHAARKQNTNLSNTVRQMTGCLEHAVTMLHSEEERLVLLKMISNARRNTLPYEEPDQPEAS